MAEDLIDVLLDTERQPYTEGMDRQAMDARQAEMSTLGLMFASMRREAIRGRQESGIEEEWREDEEFYEGIDDANRAEMGAWRSKPPGQPALGDEQRGDDDVSSNVFPNITAPYCDAAAARVGDMLLPTDDRGWALKPTPIPDLVGLAEARLSDQEIQEVAVRFDNYPPEEKEAAIEAEVARLTRERMPRQIRQAVEAETQAQYGDAPDVDARLNKNFTDLAEQAQAEIDEARQAAEKAQQRIEDWHVESQYHAEMRKVIESASRIGTGVLKGPVPFIAKQVAYKDGNLLIQEKTAPQSKNINVWNCFPDPGCGESIHDGQYHWERDDLSFKSLAALRGQPGYIDQEIDLALAEGPWEAARELSADRDGGLEVQDGLVRRDKRNLFEIWYGYAALTRENMEQAGLDWPEDRPEPMLDVVVTMVNNRIIRFEQNFLSTGEFPYDYMIWKRRAGLPWGQGVARQIRVPQRIVTAALRNMMDNAGLAGGPMWGHYEDAVEPMDGNPELRPRKGWIFNKAIKDPKLLEYAFQYFTMPMMQPELEAIIQLGLKLAEDLTGLPMLMQGQMSQRTPDTVGGMNLLNNNASTVLRRIAKLFDDHVTEPHIRRYYTYLLQYGESDEEKGDFIIDARGSSALVERDLNQQVIQAMGEMTLNPVFGADPKKWFTEWLKSHRLDPKRFEFDDEEWQGVVQQLLQSAQQGDPAVEVAQIRAEAALEVQAMKDQQETLDRELQEARLMIEESSRERSQAVDEAFKALDDEIARLAIDSEERMALERLRKDLTETAMKLKAQFEMQGQDRRAAQLTAPPVEPTGRAPDGQAFQR